MTNKKALSFKKTSKTIANTSYEGAYFNLDSSFDQHQVKAIVTHNTQKSEMCLPIVLQHGSPTAMLSSNSYQNYEIQEEVLNFAQSIVVFHQDKDSYTMSLLNEHA